jgi:hypothetical protein
MIPVIHAAVAMAIIAIVSYVLGYLQRPKAKISREMVIKLLVEQTHHFAKEELRNSKTDQDIQYVVKRSNEILSSIVKISGLDAKTFIEQMKVRDHFPFLKECDLDL